MGIMGKSTIGGTTNMKIYIVKSTKHRFFKQNEIVLKTNYHWSDKSVWCVGKRTCDFIRYDQMVEMGEL